MEKGVWVVKIVYRDGGDVFYGITGVEKWCWWVKGIEEGGVEQYILKNYQENLSIKS